MALGGIARVCGLAVSGVVVTFIKTQRATVIGTHDTVAYRQGEEGDATRVSSVAD